MKKKIVFIVIAVAAAVVGAICFFNGRVVDTADAIYPASEETGGIAEKVIGDPDTASVVLYEYADFGCSHCADWNKTINELLEKYEGKIALVFRNYDLGLKMAQRQLVPRPLHISRDILRNIKTYYLPTRQNGIMGAPASLKNYL